MITIGHGAGGRLTHSLVEKHFLPQFDNPALAEMGDAALLGDIAITTDGYVVTPRFFPGGDLGRLAVSGTVNDLVMSGAEPLGLTAGFILEEGLSLEELDRIVASMALTADQAGVQIVAGDTKVVPRGACDGIFITTSGVGRLECDFRPLPAKVKPGDAVIASGTLADHGMAVMACREGLPMQGDLMSDVAPLVGLVRCLRQSGVDIHAMRDPTRGGAAQSLVEIAGSAGVRIVLEEKWLPLSPAVTMACELLGVDPLCVANEGKFLAFVSEKEVGTALEALRTHPLGSNATTIGRVDEGDPGLELVTIVGTRRAIRMPRGELLPRIC
ncbi:MAG: hydrogenase expression/formation protein HypE [Myxococcota bacterium]|nr:hydrogenase expression/formation protein HypE [Myxococcota bacterium]